MNNLYQLEQGLKSGFIDKSINSLQEFRPSILVNDYKRGKKVLTTIKKELESCDEFWISVAFITTSGIAVLMNTLLELEQRNIKGKVLASQYLNFTHPEALVKLKKFKNIELRILVEGSFHSKGFLFKQRNLYHLIVGSSNLTQSALCSNIELNLKVSATENSQLIEQTLREFKNDFSKALSVSDNYIENYRSLWRSQKDNERNWKNNLEPSIAEIRPNKMQKEALHNIELLRNLGKSRALLISATGTGKTYLSAFDVKKVKAKTLLFLVHRRTIAETALKTFKTLFGNEIEMGLFSGQSRELDADYLFSTVQTISKRENLELFNQNHFDYIVIDETHRAGAKSYLSVINYFNPKFLLGMTATPERTDGVDVFNLFDYNLAYEIRLNDALEEKMLSPFHYYGVCDLTVNGEQIDDKTDFNKLVAEERVARIIEAAKRYGCDNGRVRGLIFCSRTEIADEFSRLFNLKGFRTISLTGKDSEIDRQQAISRLESDDRDSLDYIFTVDIFNEGIDIPAVNQIIMLRPTQSAIIFVQQLGRGLRKIEGKEYLTVIDFIGNYDNNYLVPIALYGDKSYNKDNLRKLMAGESNYIPGDSSINFDKISKEKIYESINKSNLSKFADLKRDYLNLKFKLGRIPLMVDFLNHGSRDPIHYVNYSKSYFNFIKRVDEDATILFRKNEVEFMELIESEINNGKRVEESTLLKMLIEQNEVYQDDLIKTIEKKYNYQVSHETLNSVAHNINFNFVRKNYQNVLFDGNKFILDSTLKSLLENENLTLRLNDSIEYSIRTFEKRYENYHLVDGFYRYGKYGRKDVCRILNWPLDISSTLYGYRTNNRITPCFVTYHKSENIEQSVDYNDHFIDRISFAWESRSNRKIESGEIQNVINSKRILLFIKKEDGEGSDFYFIGDCKIKDGSIKQDQMKDGKPVVHFTFMLDKEVDDDLFKYITE